MKDYLKYQAITAITCSRDAIREAIQNELIEEAILYGSRTIGTSKHASYIDLELKGEHLTTKDQ